MSTTPTATAAPGTSTDSADSGKVWFVTGASRGFGKVWTKAALERGDRVVATARNTDDLQDLTDHYGEQVLTLSLDVTQRPAVFAAVEQAVQRFGRLDVIVANAGHGLFGALEETTEAAAREQIEVNLFGTVWLLQAVAPVLRTQRSGHVLLTSSFGGLVSFATASMYGASKYAVEGLGESFAMEVSDFGVHVTLVEPAAYATDFNTSSQQTDALPDYDQARGRTGEFFTQLPPGDPAHTADAILTLVDMPTPPLRLLLGSHVLPLILDTYDQRTRTWHAHETLTNQAQ